MSMFMLTTLWRWHDNYGWQPPPHANLYYEIFHLALSVVLWSVFGYWVGTIWWKQLGSDESVRHE
jgi:hypothetical protein